jgi:uncharacterized protein with PIN domain
LKRDMKQSTWNNARKKLKQQFERDGITRCEKCGAAYPLGFAHRYKRRFITTAEELNIVALLCQMCHEKIEFSGHEKMKNAIDTLIANREINVFG